MAARVLVIGGTKFTGLSTVHWLVKAGCQVAVFHRGATEPHELRHVQHLHGNRTELLTHVNGFERFAPDVVLDMFPVTRADAIDTLIAFNGLAGRLVAVSSQDVYLAYDIMRGREPGPTLTQPLDEDAPLRTRLYPYRDLYPPDNRMYDYDKIPIEQTYLSEPDLPGTVLRLPAVYGPNDYQHRPYPYLRRMIDGRRSILLDERAAEWRRSRSFVMNCAAAIGLAVTNERATGRVYNIAETEALTERQWVEAIGSAAGWEGEIVTLPTAAMPEHLRDDDLDFSQPLIVDTSRIREELGYGEPVALRDGLVRTIEWELANLPDELPPHRFDYDAEDAALPDLTLGI